MYEYLSKVVRPFVAATIDLLAWSKCSQEQKSKTNDISLGKN